MKDWELHLALQNPQDPIHDMIEAQLARQDEFERRRLGAERRASRTGPRSGAGRTVTDPGRLWEMTAEPHAMVAAAGERAMETRAESDREMVTLLSRAHGAVNAAATFRALYYVTEGTQAEPE